MKKQLGQKSWAKGFTIVELLIVIVVIAILAAITIVAYNGITQKSTDTVMRTDLKQVSKLVEMSNTEKGSYPSSLSLVNGGKGYGASGSNTLAYVKLRSGYCISVAHPSAAPLHLMSSTGQVAAGSCEFTNGGVVTTFSGSGASGSQDGPADTARFYMLYGSVFDSAGSLYVTASDNKLRKIALDGSVSTVFSSAALGNTAFAVTIDKAGNFYFLDQDHSIRKITPAGVMSILAGSGSSGYADGTGTAAQFNGMRDITIDDSGNLYVAESQGHRIRKITPAGVVTTVSDAAGWSCTGHFYPNGVAVDSEGYLYVTDSGCNVINKVSPSGQITRLAGTPGTPGTGTADGTGASAQFNSLGDITIDSMGTLYVVDENRIRKITRSGVVTTLAGSTGGYSNGTGSAAAFNWPNALSVDDNGAVYVMDVGNYRVRKIQ